MRRFTLRRQSNQATARPPAPGQVDEAIIRERLSRSMRRRMSDDLVSLIRRACLNGHAETAKGLWVVLHDLVAREAVQKYPNGRFPAKDLLEVLAVEIADAREREAARSPENAKPAMAHDTAHMKELAEAADN